MDNQNIKTILEELETKYCLEFYDSNLNDEDSIDKDFEAFPRKMNDQELSDNQLALVEAHKTLTNFYQKHSSSIELVSSKMKYYLSVYDWEYKLETDFNVKLEGDDEISSITATWFEHGCSCYDFDEFTESPQEYSIQCIPQQGKWYRLEDGKTPLDVSIENGNTQATIEILQNENKKLKAENTHYQNLFKEKKRIDSLKSKEKTNQCSIL